MFCACFGEFYAQNVVMLCKCFDCCAESEKQNNYIPFSTDIFNKFRCFQK